MTFEHESFTLVGLIVTGYPPNLHETAKAAGMDAHAYMNTHPPTKISDKPLMLMEAAQTMKRMAEKAGWINVVITEKRRKRR